MKSSQGGYEKEKTKTKNPRTLWETVTNLNAQDFIVVCNWVLYCFFLILHVYIFQGYNPRLMKEFYLKYPFAYNVLAYSVSKDIHLPEGVIYPACEELNSSHSLVQQIKTLLASIIFSFTLQYLYAVTKNTEEHSYLPEILGVK